MIQTLDLRGRRPTRAELVDLVPRAVVDVTAATEVAASLIADVRERGEAALLDQAERLDQVRPDAVRVGPAEIGAAVDALDPAVRRAIEHAIEPLGLVAEGVFTAFPNVGDQRSSRLGCDRDIHPCTRHEGDQLGAGRPRSAEIERLDHGVPMLEAPRERDVRVSVPRGSGCACCGPVNSSRSVLR
jgi:hypothetical protein